MENLSRYIPTLKGAELDAEVVRFESRILVIAEENRRKAKETGVDDGTIVSMPGARELLSQLNMGRDTHPERRNAWAIVTSGAHILTATGAYAAKAYKAADVAEPPDSFVTSDLCSKGKPDPEPYLKGAELINAKDMSRCIVVEDAPPGVLSGKRAGAPKLEIVSPDPPRPTAPTRSSAPVSRIGRPAGVPSCPDCGAAMVNRLPRKDGERFWGCPAYPRCRGTRPLG